MNGSVFGVSRLYIEHEEIACTGLWLGFSYMHELRHCGSAITNKLHLIQLCPEIFAQRNYNQQERSLLQWPRKFAFGRKPQVKMKANDA